MIVVAGEALVDLIVSPGGSLRAVPGGGPYNAARTLGLLGEDVSFLSVLSDDYFGRQLRKSLYASNVKVAVQTPTSVPTTLAVAELSGEGSATYRFYLEGTSLPMLSAREAWGSLPADYDALHIGTLGLVVEPTASVLEALVEEEAAKRLVMLDPNCRPAVVDDFSAFSERMMRLFGKADVIKVSDDDVRFLFPHGGFDEAVREVTTRGGLVLHTAGPGPIDVYAHDGHDVVVPDRSDVVDTVGAGDIFGATVLWALLRDGLTKGQRWGLEQVLPAVRTGATAAQIACQRSGAEPPTREELLADLAAS